VGGLRRGSEGPTPRIFLCGCSFGLAQVRGRRRGQAGPWPGAWTPSPSPFLVSESRKLGSSCPRGPPAAHPDRPRAGSHRVGCGGCVVGPERRQGDGGGRPGPHSAPGEPGGQPWGSLELANGAVPSSAWEPRAGGDKRGSGGKRTTQTSPPTPKGQRIPSPRKRWKERRAQERQAREGISGFSSPACKPGGAPAAANLSLAPAGEFATWPGSRDGPELTAHVAGGQRPGGGRWTAEGGAAVSPSSGPQGRRPGLPWVSPRWPKSGRGPGLPSEPPRARVQQ
jgi:hypothetical protein